MTKELEGIVKRILYQGPEDNYCVFLLEDVNSEIHRVLLRYSAPKEGDEIVLQAESYHHPKYGFQFTSSSYQIVLPTTYEGALDYINRLHIDGLGPKTLERIGAYFGDALVHVIRKDQDLLFSVPKVRKNVANELYNVLTRKGHLQEITLFLEEANLSSKWALDIYRLFGASSVSVISENPYYLVSLLPDFPFDMADRLAAYLGFSEIDECRIKEALLQIMQHIGQEGHTCLPIDELLEKGNSLLHISVDYILPMIEELIQSDDLVLYEWDDIQYIYYYEIYDAEVKSAQNIVERLAMEEDPLPISCEDFIAEYESTYGFTFGADQKKALELAMKKRITLITGGPGTGKTTMIKAIVEAYKKSGKHVISLCAPTGRAAKRLGEAISGFSQSTESVLYPDEPTDMDISSILEEQQTSRIAVTIHSLLGAKVEDNRFYFQKNEDDQLESDVIIVDEASMLNLEICKALLMATPPSAHMIFVGDINQLPPIGAGFVFKELLAIDAIPSVTLEEIFRQAKENPIIENAYLINQGEMPHLEEIPEFQFIKVDSKEAMLAQVLAVYMEEREFCASSLDIQIVTPLRRYDTGSFAISKHVQHHLTKGRKTNTITIRGQEIGVGDKVIQNENNANINVFNGEIGIVTAIENQKITIQFVDKHLTIPVKDAIQLSLAYAITVHKSQGSEYDTVILLFVESHGRMLQRNLLYTAITRAKEKVIIIGSEKAIRRAVHTVYNIETYNLLKERIIYSEDYPKMDN